jgi:hypothetical protein
MKHAICRTVVKLSGGLATLLWLIGGKPFVSATAFSVGRTGERVEGRMDWGVGVGGGQKRKHSKHENTHFFTF